MKQTKASYELCQYVWLECNEFTQTLKIAEGVPLVEFMYLVQFTRMPGESYCRWLRSLLYLCYVFQALINSLGCWFCTSALGLILFQTCYRKQHYVKVINQSKHLIIWHRTRPQLPVRNQQTRGLIGAQKLSHKHNNKNPESPMFVAVALVQFMYHVVTHRPGESYHRSLMSQVLDVEFVRHLLSMN